MGIETTISSFETENKISVFINGNEFLTFKIENKDSIQSIFCFENIEDAEEFLRIFAKKIALYRENY